MTQNHHSTIIALDVGERRIGVAIANFRARLASPLVTLTRSGETAGEIQDLVDRHAAKVIVVGLPRSLDGRHTAQTLAVEEFKSSLEQAVGTPVHWQDEALTSRQAETELKSRKKPYTKGDVDALSAVYILEDFMRDHPEVFL